MPSVNLSVDEIIYSKPNAIYPPAMKNKIYNFVGTYNIKFIQNVLNPKDSRELYLGGGSRKGSWFSTVYISNKNTQHDSLKKK